MDSRRTPVFARWILATSALGAIVFIYKRWLHVNQTTVALSLLLLVLVIAAEWGLRYAVVLSVAAAACYNFFFLPPFNTFSIADTQNWLALLAFLATSIIASRLSQRVRDEADDARAHQRELDTLLRLSKELLHGDSVAALLPSLPATALRITSATEAYLYLLDQHRLYYEGQSPSASPHLSQLKQLAETLSATHTEGGTFQIPLRSGATPRGLLVLQSPQLSAQTADAVASLISLALERAHALENLARQQAAKESEHLRTLMIDSITHELRTPLTSIKGAATTLLSHVVTGADAQELLSIIDEESDRLNHLLSKAVEMSQLDAHQVQMHMQTFSVEDLVLNALEACSWVKAQHQVDLNLSSSARVNVDPIFFQKALCNLLENAARYSDPGTRIIVSADSVHGRASISIADHGVGIDPAEQSLIFERFYRSPNRKTGAPGTGMGLAIARAVVEAHGGDIHVTSEPTRGAVFTISLPLATT